jgi:alpha/beta superfamily hydrolase
VERGHVLERMTLVDAGDGVVLEGLFQTGGSAVPVVLAAPHPQLGGSMDSPVLAEIVWQLARRGHPTLRFNYRGVGASGGQRSADLDAAAADISRAVDQIEARAIVGYSFGASAAARVALVHDRVDRVILVAPAVADFPIDFAALDASGVAVSLFTGSDDAIAPPASLPDKRTRIIAGANHSYLRGLAELGRLVAESLPSGVD